MATAAVHAKHEKTAYEKWQETIDEALTDNAWDEYDCDIWRIVAEYNKFLGGTPGYKPLDWKTVKAMLWTESGGPSNAAWKSRPMQIGNSGDPGLKALLGGQEGGSLIIPPSLKSGLTVQIAGADPRMNIRAGVGYLLMRCAKFDQLTTTEGPVVPYTIKPGDSFDKIARENGSTPATLQKLNPTAKVLMPKQTISIQKAKTRTVIVGWEPITNATIANKYNTRDGRYADKLAYCLTIIERSKRGLQCQ
ncbi:MAG TPA: LysM domain-containing protein [Bryobacteraceae bacterium]|nr:LysM domain-containing protein [Bryobacteraceae bacterium]